MNDLKAMTLELDNKLKKEISFDIGLMKEIDDVFDPRSYTNIPLASAMVYPIKEHFRMRSVLGKLKSGLKSSGFDKKHIRETLKTAKSKIRISRRIGQLKTMQNIFRYWHIFHLPFAILMFVIMIIHIGVTIVFGYKWIF